MVYFRLIEGAWFHPVLTQLNAFLLKPLLTKTTYSTDKTNINLKMPNCEIFLHGTVNGLINKNKKQY